ncbi:hypothetical protein FRX31_007685 [Thalictrum thalictroides]|uniref:Uncharacterized protein n=1 Tax=Thalictrum thalictroides TaxID=46969 RepID=A0A7J6X0Z8_THATH|nr:hypothetical protein FRX31_007685 [Thalictrum thalictroides]
MHTCQNNWYLFDNAMHGALNAWKRILDMLASMRQRRKVVSHGHSRGNLQVYYLMNANQTKEEDWELYAIRDFPLFQTLKPTLILFRRVGYWWFLKLNLVMGDIINFCI